MTINRRHFISASAGITAAMSAPMVFGASRPQVVIIGGGAGGATAARYIAKDSKGAIDVTLVEPTRSYYTCFFSNGLTRLNRSSTNIFSAQSSTLTCSFLVNFGTVLSAHILPNL